MSDLDRAASMHAALRRLAKAVVVITCRHEGQRYAMSATAVSELSMDPRRLGLVLRANSHLDKQTNILARHWRAVDQMTARRLGTDQKAG